MNDETILVGFSCGAGFLVRWLSENKVKTGKVILVAPWIDPEHTQKSDFFNFAIDTNITERTGQLCIFYSLDDYPDVLKTVDILKAKFPLATI